MDVVTPSTMRAAGTLLADPIWPFRGHISLMHGWIPAVIQMLAAVTLVVAIGWRGRRWRLLWVPAATSFGIALAWLTHWNITSEGLAGDPAPGQLWLWIALTGLALGVAVLGWPSAHWWRRALSLATVPLCAVSAGLMLNLWVGYFPTVQTAWEQLTDGPLPGETDEATVAKMVASQAIPSKGKVVEVNIPGDASKFKHRGEVVYLPPAYFASNPPPALPTVMMIGGQFNTAADWIRSANAVTTIDDFAARHGGNAPIFVFADSGGAFNNDTECVNGIRGNAADHLTKDVVPFMKSAFGVSADPANWGVMGWSTGGTCALNLTLKYPDLFSTFVDIDGDMAPNAGTKAQTVERLYGGSSAAFAEWDPATVMAGHGAYEGVAGWFAVSTPAGTRTAPTGGSALPEPRIENIGNLESTPTVASHTLCRLASEYGIDCAVVPAIGKHDWPFAAQVLTDTLPWLASQLGTPDVPDIGLPGTRTGGVTIAASGGR